ncbi:MULTISPECIES: hypothetical protein [unclassified Bradyrhizobium]|uniref:hypothetical protein n=1 Tax=unclassified Bradyrhizobium TaxID=2631580 RepID=UPI00040536E6|nr:MULTISPECIES: hypothetical protein [unclassified Bradyrhizobium]MCP3460260.1 hypothetical protein [Bradyrhizobium sp. CCGUVB23]
MAEKRPNKDFGKRHPQPLPLPPKEPVKRSGEVALLVMGAIAVGTAAYTLIPRQNCDQPGMAACSSSGGGGGGHWSSRSSFYSSGSGGVTRGGFGSSAHAFGFSGGG